MLKTLTLFFFLLSFTLSCSSDKSQSISFYHWKSTAIFAKANEKALKDAHTSSIYLHYFDIISSTVEGKISTVPTYVLKAVAKEYNNYKIIPVIYITNQIFKTSDLDITRLSAKITRLIHQISQTQFHYKAKQIQVDCDWTQTTQYAYFQLLRALSSEFELEVTLRLHQIKFQEKTGIPPVQSAVLMVYNIGDMRKKQENSILENKIVKQYINKNTTYPLALKIGLPLFSQTIITNNHHKIRIMKGANRLLLDQDSHFEKIDQLNFLVIRDTLLNGFYLSKDYQLKLEETTEAEIIAAYQTIKKSRLSTTEIIFYHLDQDVLASINFSHLISKL